MMANIFLALWGSPCPLTQAVVNAHNTAVKLTVALLTGREPDLSSDIKEKFAKLCEEHAIIRENIIDLSNASNSGFIYLSHPEYFIIEETNPVGYQSFFNAGESYPYSWGNKVDLVPEHVLVLTQQIAASRTENEEWPEPPGGQYQMRARRGLLVTERPCQKYKHCAPKLQ
jgi:hypothetical protein